MIKSKDNQYIDSEKPSKVTKQGIRVISEMSTPRILMFVASRHSAGLKTLTIIGLVGYIAYDKIGRWFI